MHVKDIAHCPEAMLYLLAWQTKIGMFANSVDPDETARNEPSHLDLHLFGIIYFYFRLLFLHQWICPNSGMECSTSETRG